MISRDGGYRAEELSTAIAHLDRIALAAADLRKHVDDGIDAARVDALSLAISQLSDELQELDQEPVATLRAAAVGGESTVTNERVRYIDRQIPSRLKLCGIAAQKLTEAMNHDAAQDAVIVMLALWKLAADVRLLDEDMRTGRSSA